MSVQKTVRSFGGFNKIAFKKDLDFTVKIY